MQFCEDYHTVLIAAYERHHWLHDKLWIFAMKKCCGMICIHMSRLKLLAPLIMHHELPPPRLYDMSAITMTAPCMSPPCLYHACHHHDCTTYVTTMIECHNSSQSPDYDSSSKITTLLQYFICLNNMLTKRFQMLYWNILCY